MHADDLKTTVENEDYDVSESDDDDFDLSDQRKISTDTGDPEIQGLHDKYKRGRLNIQPDFQRQFVWDAQKSSRLIESAILGIPLPVIYLSEEAGGKVSVIDGQQRLTAFFSFIDGKFPNGKDFKLANLRVYNELNKKKFKDLPDEYQEKITECKIRVITFRADSDEDLKFEIFERLNSGSVKLNDQELRNCIYRGSYNNFLRDLSGYGDYRKIMGYSGPHPRMSDIEFVLRFASFYNQTYLKYKSPMKKFMNQEMEKRQNVSAERLEKTKTAFKNAVSIIFSLLGENAFRRFDAGNEKNPDGNWESKKFSASLYDVLMWSFADKDRNMVMRNLDVIKEELIDLMSSNQIFIDSISRGTSGTQRVHDRFDIWNKSLKEILRTEIPQDRCFTRALKEKFYNEDKICKICGNQISNIDDSAMDHDKQYWRGGKTIPENARLTHRYCNNARPLNDEASG